MKRFLTNISLLFAVAGASAQSDVQPEMILMHRGEVVDFEGNKGAMPSYVDSSYKLQDVDRVTFSGENMTVTLRDGSEHISKADDLEKVSLSGNVTKLPIFYPPSVSRMLNFETKTDATLDLGYTVGRNTDTFNASATEEILLSAVSQSEIILNPSVPTLYILRGANPNLLQVKISGTQDVMLLLDGVSFGGQNTPAILTEGSGKLHIATKSGTVNTLQNSIIADSDAEISLSGEGLLRIVTADSNQAAVRAKSNIYVNGGTLNISCGGYASQGIYSDKNVNITRGAINIITTGGGTQEDDNLGFNSSIGICAGVKGVKSDGIVNITGGKIRIKTNGGVGATGLAAMHTIKIKDATIVLSCFDDGMNAVDGIETGGSKIFSTSSVDDGIDSNGSLIFRGGTMYVCGPYPKEGAFDNDGKNFVIEDNITLVALGAKSDAPMGYKSTCPNITLKNTAVKKFVTIKDKAGQEIISFITPNYPDKSTMVVACPALLPKTDYEVYTSDRCTEGTELWGIITGGVFENSQKIADVISSDKK